MESRFKIREAAYLALFWFMVVALRRRRRRGRRRRRRRGRRGRRRRRRLLVIIGLKIFLPLGVSLLVFLIDILLFSSI